MTASTAMLNAAVAVFLAAPFLAGLLSLVIRPSRGLHALNFSTMVALALAEMVLTGHVLVGRPVTALGGLVYLDALSVFILFVISAVGLTSSLYMWSYLDDQVARGVIAARRLGRFFFLFHMFLFAMVTAAVANSLGVLWVAVEGTTLATTFLIAFFRRRESLEAGWKYLILCSVGIALALFGTVLTYSSSVRVLGDVSGALNITELQRVAEHLDPEVLKLAFLFLLVGYGTKIGLMPMHTWLPEAYTEAPAPVAAMLAGVLETVAVYAVLRTKTIADEALPPHYTGNLLLGFGLTSFAVAALFVLVQRNYKRLFAYSSIEHMGLAMVGFGVGGVAGTFGGLFHLLNHALAKSLAFFAAGNIHRRFGTVEIGEVQGLSRAQPLTALALGAAALALVGTPPFAPFASEMLVVSGVATQMFQADTFHLGPFLTVTVSDEARSVGMVVLCLVVLVVLFVGFAVRVTGMLWGRVPEHVACGERWGLAQVSILLTVAALVVFGVMIPEPIHALLERATGVLLGG